MTSHAVDQIYLESKQNTFTLRPSYSSQSRHIQNLNINLRSRDGAFVCASVWSSGDSFSSLCPDSFFYSVQISVLRKEEINTIPC